VNDLEGMVVVYTKIFYSRLAYAKLRQQTIFACWLAESIEGEVITEMKQ
jgi:hypothetical protein